MGEQAGRNFGYHGGSEVVATDGQDQREEKHVAQFEKGVVGGGVGGVGVLWDVGQDVQDPKEKEAHGGATDEGDGFEGEEG